jgi:hypothetical protein
VSWRGGRACVFFFFISPSSESLWCFPPPLHVCENQTPLFPHFLFKMPAEGGERGGKGMRGGKLKI